MLLWREQKKAAIPQPGALCSTRHLLWEEGGW
jgi:hypothetical protein